MKRFFCATILLTCSVIAAARAEEAAPDAAPAMPAEVVSPAPVPAETPAPAAELPAVPAAAAAAEEAPLSENLEFVSGEVTAVNEASKSLTVKLYGETDAQAADKTLTVTVDGNTDITDGEKDRDLKSLTASTEVDVEYDPASNRATYIFVY